MGEYDKEQRNKPSRVIANGEPKSKQLKEFVDKRKNRSDKSILIFSQKKATQLMSNSIIQNYLLSHVDNYATSEIAKESREYRLTHDPNAENIGYELANRILCHGHNGRDGHSEEQILAKYNFFNIDDPIHEKIEKTNLKSKIKIHIYTDKQPCQDDEIDGHNCHDLLNNALTDDSIVYYLVPTERYIAGYLYPFLEPFQSYQKIQSQFSWTDAEINMLKELIINGHDMGSINNSLPDRGYTEILLQKSRIEREFKKTEQKFLSDEEISILKNAIRKGKDDKSIYALFPNHSISYIKPLKQRIEEELKRTQPKADISDESSTDDENLDSKKPLEAQLDPSKPFSEEEILIVRCSVRKGLDMNSIKKLLKNRAEWEIILIKSIIKKELKSIQLKAFSEEEILMLEGAIREGKDDKSICALFPNRNKNYIMLQKSKIEEELKRKEPEAFSEDEISILKDAIMQGKNTNQICALFPTYNKNYIQTLKYEMEEELKSTQPKAFSEDEISILVEAIMQGKNTDQICALFPDRTGSYILIQKTKIEKELNSAQWAFSEKEISILEEAIMQGKDVKSICALFPKRSRYYIISQKLTIEKELKSIQPEAQQQRDYISDDNSTDDESNAQQQRDYISDDNSADDDWDLTE